MYLRIQNALSCRLIEQSNHRAIAIYLFFLFYFFSLFSYRKSPATAQSNTFLPKQKNPASVSEAGLSFLLLKIKSRAQVLFFCYFLFPQVKAAYFFRSQKHLLIFSFASHTYTIRKRPTACCRTFSFLLVNLPGRSDCSTPHCPFHRCTRRGRSFHRP